MMLAGFAIASSAAGCDRIEERLDLRPKQKQSPARVAEIAALRLQREGRLRMTAVRFDDRGPSAVSTRMNYELNAPWAHVEDTDIRGFLDGSMKYPFNQGTSYHMRVGRRYGGPRDGRFELKRSLVRWVLPELPADARMTSASVTVWIESFLSDSPLRREREKFLPLHLYLYPVREEWGAGKGGIRQDDFSRAAPGEASWTDARAEELAWTAPGALTPDAEGPGNRYVVPALAVGTIVKDNAALSLEGGGVAEYLQEVYEEGSTFSVLLKLEDDEEDRWGTELAILSSNFGSEKDAFSKRPRLEFELEVPGPAWTSELSYALEAGTEHVASPLRHPGGTVVIALELEEGDGIPPALFVRGGKAGQAPVDVAWEPYHYPVVREWDWSQVKLAAPGQRLGWGDTLRFDLQETWVRPGPPEKQVPELVLVSPSGRQMLVAARPDREFWYRFEFQPDEFGLWRYGWSFRPTRTRPLGSHEGEGVFYLGIPGEPTAGQRLEQLAEHLVASLEEVKFTDPVVQNNIDGFTRWAAAYRLRGPEERQIADRLLELVGEALVAADP
ncbi:MAG: hypothetical protein JSU87_17830 [Gemmatimonadota bacterium]|nr:MAG: hypothetical protein JSU87_17830 [Gemmatimonadota bacterium]